MTDSITNTAPRDPLRAVSVLNVWKCFSLVNCWLVMCTPKAAGRGKKRNVSTMTGSAGR